MAQLPRLAVRVQERGAWVLVGRGQRRTAQKAFAVQCGLGDASGWPAQGMIATLASWRRAGAALPGAACG